MKKKAVWGFIAFSISLVAFAGLVYIDLTEPQSYFARFLFVQAPAPYRGVKTKVNYISSTCANNRADYKTIRYETNHPLADLQKYYNQQMNKYCINQWVWNSMRGGQGASCELSRSQYFSVHLIDISPRTTQVVQSQYFITRVDFYQEYCGE